ncbi:histidine kinase [Agrobacterium deltaense]|uniref:hypothetical protein n=1 Tax=Agrobacterium TaxID=357 RepID=UPI000745A071|nr:MULTISPECIES: hypothetical protein [Agrobacterium]KVK44922.1 hypothetical protein L901_06925 [Agrobacterium sp. D14]RKF35279.1 histidine kinase [Agrobacterium deltaense]
MLCAFRGKKLIVVERRPSLTAACHAQLIAAGATVAGPVSSVEQVLNLLEAGDVDGAIIDVKVDVEMMLRLAMLLESMATPFVFASFIDVNSEGYSFGGDRKHLRKIADVLFGSPGPASTLH